MSNTAAANLRPVTHYDVTINDEQEISLERIFGPLDATKTSRHREHLRDTMLEIVRHRASDSPMMAWSQLRDQVYELRLLGPHLSAGLRAAGASQATIEFNLSGSHPWVRPTVSYSTRVPNTAQAARDGLRATTVLAVNTVFAYAVHRQIQQRLTEMVLKQRATIKKREHVTLRDQGVRFRNLAKLRVAQGS